MKLFAVRLENADTIVVAAVDEQDALQKAGLTPDALNYVQNQLKNLGQDFHRAELVLDGIGPQKHEIRELKGAFLILGISDLGTFALKDMDEPTHEALMEGYPIMQKAHEAIANKWHNFEEIEKHRAEHDELVEAAFSREKTRLMVPTEEDEL